ncbi:hypothetical protein K7X08_000096 [Anisodus acutangulus]|uniref:Pentatricopeptide repeat-containing protein n=1 Tax=Anisodus acutangulus TaxID=402998 RepID=A0A9Q1M618_9SOLA|nr:hypothetical protein K7X08_000096 [Anisodus acutangulus]
MLAHGRPNDFAYASVLSVCDSSRGRQVHAFAIKTGFDTCVYVGNSLIAMYSRNISTGGHYSEAWKVFNDMEFHNLVSWNTIIALFQMCGQGDKAMRFFSVMHRDSLGFDRATLVSVLSSLLGMDEIDFSWGRQSCFQLHCVSVKTGLILDVGIVTALVKAYSTLRGDVSDCYKLFLETNGCQDLVLWTEIIVAFSERDPEKAILLFGQLRREGLNVDSYAFSIALKACAGLVTDRNALMVHCEVIKYGFVESVVLGNALIHAYARCGSISQANQGAVRLLDLYSGMCTKPKCCFFVCRYFKEILYRRRLFGLSTALDIHLADCVGTSRWKSITERTLSFKHSVCEMEGFICVGFFGTDLCIFGFA